LVNEGGESFVKRKACSLENVGGDLIFGYEGGVQWEGATGSVFTKSGEK